MKGKACVRPACRPVSLRQQKSHKLCPITVHDHALKVITCGQLNKELGMDAHGIAAYLASCSPPPNPRPPARAGWWPALGLQGCCYRTLPRTPHVHPAASTHVATPPLTAVGGHCSHR